MNPKYQQNLDTINEYIKEQDLIIKVKGFTPTYSTSDEKAILRFMVLASVLEYAKPAFEKFAQHFDTRDSNLESSVRLFTRAIKLDVADLPRVAATTNKSGDLRVELFQASSVAKGVWLFCYGSNGLSQLEERLGRGNFEYHPAVLRAGKLVFAGRSSNWSNGGVAAVAPADKDYFVIGGVVKVTKSELLTLDKYEGVARNIYARQQASVITYMDSESNAVTRVKALLYNRVDVINENYVANKPSLQYQHAIIKARKEFWADHPNKLKILNAKLAALVSGASAQNSVSETNTAPSKPAEAQPERKPVASTPKPAKQPSARPITETTTVQPSSGVISPKNVSELIADIDKLEPDSYSPEDTKKIYFSAFRAIQKDYIAESGESIFPRTKVKPLQPSRASTWFIWHIGFPELAKILDLPYKDSKSAMAAGYIVPAVLDGDCSYAYSPSRDGDLQIRFGVRPSGYYADANYGCVCGYLIKLSQTEMKKVVSAHEQQIGYGCEYFVTDGNKYHYTYNCVDVLGNKHTGVKFFFDANSSVKYDTTAGGFSDVSPGAKKVLAARSLAAPIWTNMSMRLIDLAESTYKKTGTSMFNVTALGLESTPRIRGQAVVKADAKGTLAFCEVVPDAVGQDVNTGNQPKLSKLKRLSDTEVRNAVAEAQATGNIGKYLPNKRAVDNVKLLFRYPKPTRSSTPTDRVAAYAAQLLANKISNNPFVALNVCMNGTKYPFIDALGDYISVEKADDGSPVPNVSLSAGVEFWISQLLLKDTHLAVGGDWGAFYDNIPKGVVSEEAQLFIYATKILSEITGEMYDLDGQPVPRGKAGDMHKNPAYAREMLTDIIDKLRETPNYSTTSIKSLVALVKKEIDSVSLPMISPEARKQVRAIMDQGLGWFVAQYEEEVRQNYTEQARQAESRMLKTKKGYVICYDASDVFLRMAFDVPKMMDTSEYEALSGKALSEMVAWVVGYVTVDSARVDRAVEDTVQYYSKMLTHLFYTRASNKIGRIIDKRMSSGGVKNAELLKKDIKRLSGEFPLLTATWRLEFKDRSAFTLGMSVKTNTSSKGKSFFQFPTTFTDVRFKTGRTAGVVSENDMQNIF